MSVGSVIVFFDRIEFDDIARLLVDAPDHLDVLVDWDAAGGKDGLRDGGRVAVLASLRQGHNVEALGTAVWNAALDELNAKLGVEIEYDEFEYHAQVDFGVVKDETEYLPDGYSAKELHEVAVDC